MNDTALEVFASKAHSTAALTSVAAMPVATDLRRAMDAVFARLLGLIDTRGGIVIHITATTPGEGTSTIARALAVAGARSDWCKTALIDANPVPGPSPPRGTLPALLEQYQSDGDPVLLREVMDGATVHTARLQAAGAAAPSSERLRGLLEVLRKTYSLTVIDCPSVTTAPSAAAMSRLMDGVVLVVGAEQVRATEVLQVRGQLEQLGANLLGVVLNKRRERLPRLLSRWF